MEIGTVNGATTINTKSGEVRINNLLDNLIYTSDSGNLTIGSAKTAVSASTVTGDVNVKFVVEQTPDLANPKTLIVSTSKGKVVATGVERIQLTITDKGSADIGMENVVGNCWVKSGPGAVNITIKEVAKTVKPEGWAKYILSTESITGNGSVSVNLSSTEQQNTGGYTDVSEKISYVNGATEECENILSIIITTGSLKIRDSLTVNY